MAKPKLYRVTFEGSLLVYAHSERAALDQAMDDAPDALMLSSYQITDTEARLKAIATERPSSAADVDYGDYDEAPTVGEWLAQPDVREVPAEILLGERYAAEDGE